jgi:hypothetical protein
MKAKGNVEGRLAKLEEAATFGERFVVRPLSDAPAHLRQRQSFVQTIAAGHLILWADNADLRA